MLDFALLAQQCAPSVDTQTMTALVRVESNFNPWAIGVVHGRLARQPRSLPEALVTARSLDAQGYGYSVGLAQIFHANFALYGLTLEQAFDPCANLAVGARILSRCYEATHPQVNTPQMALRGALACYYTGQPYSIVAQGYVQKVVAAATDVPPRPIPVVPAIGPLPEPTNNESLPSMPSSASAPHATQPAPASHANPDPGDAKVF